MMKYLFSKKWQYTLLIPCLFLVSSFAIKHAFYIGVIQITMEETMTVQVKVFSDDLQAILQNDIGYQKVGAINQLCTSHSDKLQDYFQRKLQIHINAQPIELVLAECEQLNEVHLFEFKVSQCPSSWQQMLIEAPFFMELFPTQSNIVQLNYKHKENGRRFSKITLEASSLQFKFDED